MSTTASILRIAGIICILSALSGCEGGGTSTSPTNNNTNAPLAGVVMKGPVEGAIVNLYSIQTNSGARGTRVDGNHLTERSPNDALPGRWSSALSPSTPLIIAASGGTYTDEATGNPVNLGTRELLGLRTQPSNPAIAVTPITHALLLQAKAQIQAGATPSLAFDRVIQSAKDSFGFNVVETQPRDPLAPPANLTVDQQKYTALLGGLSNLLDTDTVRNPATPLAALTNADPFDLVLAFAKDLADGKLDGQGIDESGNAINSIPVKVEIVNTVDFPALTTATNGIDVLYNAAHAFASNAANLSAVNSSSFPVKVLQFGAGGTDFVPTVTSTGNPTKPQISWVGSQAKFIRVNRKTNTNPLARAAWVIGTNTGQSFAPPVTYFVTPPSARTRTFLMIDNGDGTFGESSLTPNITYQFTVTLVDGTSGTVEYTP